MLLFGLPLVGRFTSVYAGSGPDPQFMLWSIAWWPYALSHHLNPLHTNLVWAPDGFDLTWSTSNLLQGLLIAPITARFGPIAALNVLQLMMPAISAWSGFLLIRELTKREWPAVLGGYLYGFSPFIIGHQMGAHLFASAAFLLPLMVLLTIRQLEGRLSDRAFVALLATSLIAQFLMGLELLASAGLFGTIALLVAWIVWRDRRGDLVRSAKLVFIAIAVAALALAPILVPTFRASGMGRHHVWSDHGVDLLELLLPGSNFLLGRILGINADVIPYDHFARDLGGYVGLPILLVVAIFLLRSPNRERRRFLAAMLAISYVAALGPALHIGGRSIVAMPWRLFDGLPFINSAQAARFSIVLDLLFAVIVASSFTAMQIRSGAKVALAALVVFSILPNFGDDSLWATDPQMPKFLGSGQYQRYLRPGENVLLLPYGAKGQAMAWQALTGMYFAMAEGWTGPTPPSFAAWPIMDTFNYGVDIPEKQFQLSAFVAVHRVTAIMIDRRHSDFAALMALLDQNQILVEQFDDMVLARPSRGLIDAMGQVTATAMHCRMDEARLHALVSAAAQYLKAGLPLDQLTPLAAEERGFLPPHWVEDRDRGSFTRAGLGLGLAARGDVLIGVITPAACVEHLVERYQHAADEILFPAPHRWGTRREEPQRDGHLVFTLALEKIAQLSSQ